MKTLNDNKVYTDDPLVHYKNSGIPPERTRIEIEALLETYGIKRNSITWNWSIPTNITLAFSIEENINGKWVNARVLVDCPEIWDRFNPRTRPPRPEMINWLVSMRALHWYIKSHLETWYARQTSMIMTFAENVEVDRGRRFKDVGFPMLEGERRIEPRRNVSLERTITIEKPKTLKERLVQGFMSEPSYLKKR